ncbi:hypothetical protein GGR56DRAFT_344238 [Xylariaceae sp. FL0804]|nr:hypothetical protein GGR56DRAFT_344238 [Xylariaceae sp. FL0804]
MRLAYQLCVPAKLSCVLAWHWRQRCQFTKSCLVNPPFIYTPRLENYTHTDFPTLDGEYVGASGPKALDNYWLAYVLTASTMSAFPRAARMLLTAKFSHLDPADCLSRQRTRSLKSSPSSPASRSLRYQIIMLDDAASNAHVGGCHCNPPWRALRARCVLIGALAKMTPKHYQGYWVRAHLRRLN